jgi:DNA-binding HxlR family transcriptional regulator
LGAREPARGEASGGGDRNVGRPGELALKLLATPLYLQILRSLVDGPRRLAELRRLTGLPAQTTLRAHLANLEAVGAVAKRPSGRAPHSVETVLAPLGDDLCEVALVLERWLARAPEAPIALESTAARGIVKALVDGWAAHIMRELAVRPMSLTELDRLIPELTYPALERRLSSMRMGGLVEARRGEGPGTPYALTEWSRLGIAPLAAAIRCERIHFGDRAPAITKADIESALLLAAPLAGLPAESNGVCQLQVEEPAAEAGIRVQVDAGRVVSCECAVGLGAGAFAKGSMATWFAAIKDGSPEELRIEGRRGLAESLVRGLHEAIVAR